MKSLCPLLLLAMMLAGGRAHANEATVRTHREPLRVAIECESEARTKACPEFLVGFIEASPLLLATPRASAQVVLHVAVVPVANDDHMHLRFVGDVRGAPPSVEVDVAVNTRGTDDEQRAQLEPAFVRGVALYLAAIYPDTVTIELVTPEAAEVVATSTSPWGFKIVLNGSGDWTSDYKSASGNTELTVQRIERTQRFSVTAGAYGGMSRRPPVVVDGAEVSLDTREWGLFATGIACWHLSRDWAIATSLWGSRDDPKGQFRYQSGGDVGIEWDRYPSDDPRGNVLAVAYRLAASAESYNFPNELGERSAIYPFHRFLVAGRVRHDKALLGLNLELAAELIHPTRRYDMSLSPSIEWQLGDHVDLAFRFSAGQRAVPQPIIPEDDVEAQGRAAYAQPLYASGVISLNLHFDPTNGVRNNRFENL